MFQSNSLVGIALGLIIGYLINRKIFMSREELKEGGEYYPFSLLAK